MNPVELTPLGGHPITCVREESTQAENTTPISTGVSRADGLAGSGRALA